MKFNKKPKFTTKFKQMHHTIKTIENDFLQAVADTGAFLTVTGNDYWMMTNIGHIWFKIEDESIHLECIAVRVENRRQGNGRTLMGYITSIADDTNTPVTLKVSTVGNKNNFTRSHMVVAIGEPKKNKIPVSQLTKWYESIGFVKTPEYTAKERNMIYSPKK